MAAEESSQNDELELLTKRVNDAKDHESLHLALRELMEYLDKRLGELNPLAAKTEGAQSAAS